MTRSATCSVCGSSFRCGSRGPIARYCSPLCYKRAQRGNSRVVIKDRVERPDRLAEVDAILARMVEEECAMPWERSA